LNAAPQPNPVQHRRFPFLLIQGDIEEVVLQTQDGVSPGSVKIGLDKETYSSFDGSSREAPSPTFANRLKKKTSALPRRRFPQGKDLADVVFGQGEHHHRIDVEIPEEIKESITLSK